MDYHIRLWLICAGLALFGTIPMALDRTFPNNAQSAMLGYLRKEIFNNRTDAESTLYFLWSIYITGTNIGGILISFGVPWVTDNLGRPKALAITSMILLTAHALQALSRFPGAWPLLFIGRFCFSCSLEPMMVVLAVYLSEAAPPQMRGRLGTFSPISVIFGNLISYTIGLPALLGNPRLWVVGYVICFIMTLPLIPLCLSLKETPVFLLAKGKEEATDRSLTYYRGPDGAKDLPSLHKDAESRKKGTKTGLRTFYELLKLKPLCQPMVIAILIMFCYCAEGLFTSYSSATFEAAGVRFDTAAYLTVVLQAACIGSFFVCFFIVDRYGRRPLVLVGLIGAAVCWLSMTVSQTVVSVLDVKYTNHWATIIFVISAFGAQLFLNMGIRPIFWIIVPEILPFKYRSSGKALTFVIAGLYNLVLFIMYFNMLESYPILAHLYVTLKLTLVGVFMYFKLPETKRKAAHEIFPALLSLIEEESSKKTLVQAPINSRPTLTDGQPDKKQSKQIQETTNEKTPLLQEEKLSQNNNGGQRILE